MMPTAHRGVATQMRGGPANRAATQGSAAEYGRRKRMYRNMRLNQSCATAIAAALGIALAVSGAHAQDPVKCRRAIIKNAAKLEATVGKSLQKCEDGKLKGKIMACPDTKATTKIGDSRTKAVSKIGDACT